MTRAGGFRDKVCLVTGASSGLGRELAIQIGRRGGWVGLMARRQDLLQAVARQVEEAGARALVLPGDVRDADRVEEAVDQIARTWGRIDVAIANAGVVTTTWPVRHQRHEVDAMIDVNLRGAIWLVLAALRPMIAQGGGHLVGISSLAGYRGLPKSAVYCATKAGLNAFLESVRIAHARDGIRVTTACPGFIRTPMIEGTTLPTPQAMEADVAARRILKAIERRESEIAFPHGLAAVVRLGQLLPNRWYDALFQGFRRKKRRG